MSPPTDLDRNFSADKVEPDFFDSVLMEDHDDLQSHQPTGSSLMLDGVVCLAIASLVLAVWQFSRMGFFEAGDRIGYWLGVAGGVLLLLLFFYPVRKYTHMARDWGRMKWWLWGHMVLGISAPLLILLHSTFRVGSLNAAVALYSMLAVAISGVFGRFIYARVNRGLHGEQANLKDLQLRAGLQQSDVMSKLSFAPHVESRLAAFEKTALQPPSSWLTYLQRVFWLPLQQWRVYRQCVSELHGVLRTLAQRDHWTAADWHRREKNGKTLVARYLNAVTRVAQFSAYERLFSLWHIVHVPFLYLMVISAVVHVCAVHIY